MRFPDETQCDLPLSGMRVLEIADGVAGPYAAKLLGHLGAEVIKLEPTGGDSARTLGPFPDGKIDPERSGMFVYLNASKRHRTLDLDQSANQATCRSLAASVDVLIESFPAGERDQHGLDIRGLRRLNPALVVVSVTPFGQTGPRAAWRGNDLIAFHSSGFAFGFPALEADNPCLPPLNAPTYAAEFLAGQVAATAAMHGVLVAQQTGVGCHLAWGRLNELMAAERSRPPRRRG